MNPSISPSLAPTFMPTIPPTNAPSRAPTQSGIYTHYFEISYNLSSMPREYTDYMAKDLKNITMDMSALIEQGYVDHNDEWRRLEYRDFWLRLQKINDNIIDQLAKLNGLDSQLDVFRRNEGLILNYIMECSLYICDQIQTKYDKEKFERKTEELLNEYFEEKVSIMTQNTDAEQQESASFSFTQSSMSDIEEFVDPEPEEIPFSWIIGSCASVVVLLFIWGISCYIEIQKEIIQRQTIYINNPMVISIAIGFYDENPKKKEITGYLKNLDGVRVDINNSVKLFGKESLNYQIYPNIYYDQNIDDYKAYWEETELVEFLKTKSVELEYNLLINQEKSSDRYDGLVVIISCHGLEGYIITSDYKKISKTAIHRIFSGKKPLSRKVPRLFLFDCCSGNAERDTEFRSVGYKSNDDEESSSEEEGEEDRKGINRKTERNTRTLAVDKTKQEHDEYEQGKGTLETGKQTEVRHITRQDTVVWAYDENNPDYRLVTIMAANEGFQSKMRIDTGSYVITEFVDRLRRNIFKSDNSKFLNEILDEIQEELHDKMGKQLMVKTFNNKTEFIKFEKNNNKDKHRLSENHSLGHELYKNVSRLQYLNNFAVDGTMETKQDKEAVEIGINETNRDNTNLEMELKRFIVEGNDTLEIMKQRLWKMMETIAEKESYHGHNKQASMALMNIIESNNYKPKQEFVNGNHADLKSMTMELEMVAMHGDNELDQEMDGLIEQKILDIRSINVTKSKSIDSVLSSDAENALESIWTGNDDKIEKAKGIKKKKKNRTLITNKTNQTKDVGKGVELSKEDGIDDF